MRRFGTWRPVGADIAPRALLLLLLLFPVLEALVSDGLWFVWPALLAGDAEALRADVVVGVVVVVVAVVIVVIVFRFKDVTPEVVVGVLDGVDGVVGVDRDESIVDDNGELVLPFNESRLRDLSAFDSDFDEYSEKLFLD